MIFNEFINNNWLILVIGLVIIIVIVTALILSNKKPKKPQIASDEFENILRALGNNNIVDISKVTDRLKITLKDKTLINVKTLQSLEITASLNGLELTILYRKDSNALYKFIKGSLKWDKERLKV